MQEDEAREARQALEANKAHIAFVEHQVARKAAAKERAKQAALQVREPHPSVFKYQGSRYQACG